MAREELTSKIVEQGKRKKKAPTKNEMSNRLTALSIENEILKAKLSNMFYCIPDNEDKRVYRNESMGVTISILGYTAIVQTTYSMKIFNHRHGSENTPFVYLFQYVLSKNSKEEDLTDQDRLIIEMVERWLYILFNNDTTICNHHNLAIEYAHFVSKVNAIASHTEGEVKYSDITTAIAKTHLITSLISADDSLTTEEFDSSVEQARDIINNHIDGISTDIAPLKLKLNDNIAYDRTLPDDESNAADDAEYSN